MVALCDDLGAVFPDTSVDRHDPVWVHLPHHVAYRPPVWRARSGRGYMRRRSRRTTAGLLVHGNVPGVGLLRARICADARNLRGIRPVGDHWPRIDAAGSRSCRSGSSGPPPMAIRLILRRQKWIAIAAGYYIWFKSQERAKSQSRLTVAGEMPRVLPTSSSVSPPKYLSSTTCAARESNFSKRLSARSRSTTLLSVGTANPCASSSEIVAWDPPRFWACLFLA